MLERDIQAKILKHLASMPDTWACKVVQANKNGVCDILACIKGRFYGIEVKTATGRLSAIQAAQIERIEAAGGVALVVRSLDDLIRELSKC